ncbi:MAG: response regulator [Coriobacteriales bacterium]|jgi:putative two-component system response regulator|nr:response regulator [Coriobacteriales bacterium]
MASESRKPVILTVDDDPIILNSVLATLKEDYTVRPFTSGEAALKFLDKNEVDLILLDHNMPEMTGFDVLKALQAESRFRAVPVIFLTGSVNSEDEVSALELGAVDYLLKPFRPRALITRVHLQLELFRHRNHLEEMVAEKTVQLQTVNKKLEQRDRITLDLLAQASDLRDHDTGTHIDRTTAYTRILVEHIIANPTEGYTLSAEYGHDIIDAVKLHDLGKLAMPDSVLLKPGRLTEEEFAIIRTHPIHGSEMLKQAIQEMEEDSLLQTALDIAFGHHEKWDGSGYPGGIAGEDIPLCARITAIADVFDALTSVRPYKRAFTPEEAFGIIYKDAGTHFDPYLVEILRLHEADFTSITISNKDDIASTRF